MKTRHVVAIIIEKGDAYLFGRKARNKGPYPNKWLLIGGGIEGSETILEALHREVREETGLKVTDVEPLFIEEDDVSIDDEMVHFVFLICKVQWKSGEARPGDDIVELRWVKKGDIATLELPRPSIKIFKKLGLLKG